MTYIIEAIDRYLNEQRLTTSDRKTITSAIVRGKSQDFKVKGLDNAKVEAKDTDEGILLSFDSKLTELAASLVDIADTLGYDFDSTQKGNKTQFLILSK